jgi:hypothetical protein
VFIKTFKGFLLNLCLKLASLFLSLARKLSGPSILPGTREVFAAPAVALLLFAAISPLSSQSSAADVRAPGSRLVGSRSGDVSVPGCNSDLTDKA